jgi:hypothetical protein
MHFLVLAVVQLGELMDLIVSLLEVCHTIWQKFKLKSCSNHLGNYAILLVWGWFFLQSHGHFLPCIGWVRHCQVSDKAILVRVTYSSTFFPFSYLTQAIAWFWSCQRPWYREFQRLWFLCLSGNVPSSLLFMKFFLENVNYTCHLCNAVSE